MKLLMMFAGLNEVKVSKLTFEFSYLSFLILFSDVIIFSELSFKKTSKAFKRNFQMMFVGLNETDF